jgi:hypothetical protein
MENIGLTNTLLGSNNSLVGVMPMSYHYLPAFTRRGSLLFRTTLIVVIALITKTTLIVEITLIVRTTLIAISSNFD